MLIKLMLIIEKSPITNQHPQAMPEKGWGQDGEGLLFNLIAVRCDGGKRMGWYPVDQFAPKLMVPSQSGWATRLFMMM